MLLKIILSYRSYLTNRLHRLEKQAAKYQNSKQRVEDLLLGYQYFRKKGRKKRKHLPIKKEEITEQPNTTPRAASLSSTDCYLMGKSKTVYPIENAQEKIQEKEDSVSIPCTETAELNQIEVEETNQSIEFEIDWEAESIVLERVSTAVDLSPTITFDEIQTLNSALTQTHELSSSQIKQARTTIEILEGTALMKDLKKRTDYESLVRKRLFRENEIVDTSKNASVVDSLFEIK